MSNNLKRKRRRSLRVVDGALSSVVVKVLALIKHSTRETATIANNSSNPTITQKLSVVVDKLKVLYVLLSPMGTIPLILLGVSKVLRLLSDAMVKILKIIPTLIWAGALFPLKMMRLAYKLIRGMVMKLKGGIIA